MRDRGLGIDFCVCRKNEETLLVFADFALKMACVPKFASKFAQNMRSVFESAGIHGFPVSSKNIRVSVSYLLEL